MAGSVVTLSPRIHAAELERKARARIARGGVAVYVAATADRRQRAHLHRLRDRLMGDPALEVHCSDQPGGTTQLAAWPVGQPPAGWWGQPPWEDSDDPETP
jgi:hypothetical protein